MVVAMTAAVQIRLDRTAAALPMARDAALAFRSLLPERGVEDLRLVLSELVTNAVVHGDGATIDLRLEAEGGVVRGEVVDGGDGFALPPWAIALLALLGALLLGGTGALLVRRRRIATA